MLAAILVALLVGGWGNVGHKIINANTVNSFPSPFQQFSIWKDSLSAHGSDADNRKSADPNEGPKHYIDFEEYADFVSKGTVIQDYDSAKKVYGVTNITNSGSLPWTILQCYDTLVTVFKNKEWHHAVLLCSDLGHYIGDANMPLHLTANYNGQMSGQKGIHSRYESTMISTYSSSIPIHQNQAVYLNDVRDYIFTMTYNNYPYVDSVLHADSVAYAASGKNYKSTVYTQTLWNLTKEMTGIFFSRAAEVLASVMYTAWVNAGSPSLNPSFAEELSSNGIDFVLSQNFPNPFNPTTKIVYQLSTQQNVSMKLYDVNGREVATLLDGRETTGTHEIQFDPSTYALSSGIYFYRLRAGKSIVTKKMIFLK